MKFLLDTNSVIHLLTNAFPELARRVGETEAGEIGMSSISFAEVALGVHRGHPPEQSVLDAFASEIPLVAFDEVSARVYATLPFRRANFDRLIAAQALQHGLVVITRNIRDFSDVPGLMVQDWAQSPQ